MPGPYKLGYLDPPWRFEPYNRINGLAKSPEQHYTTLRSDKIIDEIAKQDWAVGAQIAMWVYDPMLDEAIHIAEACDFRFVTVLFRWIKTTNDQMRLFDPTPTPNYGTGYHTRGGACEECWLFRRKGIPLQVRTHDIRKEFFAPVREHSRKPDQVAQWLVDLYGECDRLEMFARTQRPGWDAHGLEVEKFK